MTCREKLVIDHPEMNDYDIGYAVGSGCPSDYGYTELLKNCDDCKACWDQTIPNEFTFEHNGEPIAKLVDIYEENCGITAVIEPIIKDSGDRTEFATGAVRDMRAGKGRCDLMPLEVLCRMFDRHDGKMGIFDYISHFQNTNQTHFLIKALDRFALDTYGNTEKEAYATMFLEVAKHFEEGAKKYGESNSRRGIPVYCYIDSAVRHYLKWLRGDTDEPHDRAFVWNIMCCIWEVDYHNDEASDN
jgi:hypothetical protein